MKYFWILIMVLIITSCSKSNEEILKQTKKNLSSEEAIGYRINQLVIEGSTSIDTLYIKSEIDAILKLSKSDTLIGYQCAIEHNGIHPNFNIPVRSRYYYNTSSFIIHYESEFGNQRKEIEIPKLNSSGYMQILDGHIPMILKILNYTGFKLLIQKDTIFDNSDCIQISVIDDEDIPYELYIDKKTCFPKFLRITINNKQPFIKEYSYTNFEYLDSVEDDSFEAKEIIVSDGVKPFEIGDTLPSWRLNYLDGKIFDFNTTRGKTTILYLSMINCGWCQAATPYIKNLYKKYQNSDVQFLVFYPIDSKEKLDKYVIAKEIDFPIIYNSKENTKERFAIIKKLKFGYPKTFILNEKNKAIWKFDGYSPKIEEIIEMELKNSAHNNGS